MRPIPKRFRVPLGIAWAASAIAVVLVTAPGGKYDPTLAILTLTVIAVIWYTYFTYRSVHEKPLAYVVVELTYDGSFEVLAPIVRNPTERGLEVRLNLDIWVDRKAVAIDAFYSGKEPKPLGPTQGFRGAVDLRPYTK